MIIMQSFCAAIPKSMEALRVALALAGGWYANSFNFTSIEFTTCIDLKHDNRAR